MKPKLHTQILVAMVVGAVIGAALGPRVEAIRIVGDLFIRLLRMVVIPLILASMVSGVVSLGASGRRLGRLGLQTLGYYAATTILAVLVGLVLVNIIRPGAGVSLPEAVQQTAPEARPPSWLSVVTDIVPQNPITAMATDQVLSVIFLALLLGVAICTVGDKARPLAAFFEALNAVMLRITGWIMLLAPIGVAALMAHTIGTMGFDAIRGLAAYMLTVLLGLAIHAFITLPLILGLVGRTRPWRFIRDVFAAVATAFSTSSSAATLPVTMTCLEKNAGLSDKVVGFVVPIGATVNMDGTALYEAVAAMFIAQVYGVEMGISQQVLIMLTATLASVGAAAIPSAGLFTMMIVLQAVGLPVEAVGLILAVDRILDMFRTAVNVWGDACGAAVVNRLQAERGG